MGPVTITHRQVSPSFNDDIITTLFPAGGMVVGLK